jgi:hypothetical protein
MMHLQFQTLAKTPVRRVTPRLENRPFGLLAQGTGGERQHYAIAASERQADALAVIAGHATRSRKIYEEKTRRDKKLKGP